MQGFSDPRRSQFPIGGAGQLNPNADGMPVPDGLGPARLQPSQPQGPGSEQGVPVALPGEDFPPAGATPVDEIGEADFGFNQTKTLLTITVPPLMRFRLAAVGFGADDEAILRYISWSILATPPGTPIPGYSNKQASIGNIATPSWVFTTQGSTVQLSWVLTASFNAATDYHIFVRAQGWFYADKKAGAR